MKAACFVFRPVGWLAVASSPLPELMLGLPIGLRQRLLRPSLFLVACSVAKPVIVEALALGLGFGLVAPRKPEVGLRRPALLWPGLLWR